MKNIQRKYYPGDEWLYFKIYCGIKTSEKILLNYIYPYVKHLEKEGIICKWFFIRYQDPDFHLRVRLFISDKKHVGTIVNGLNQKCRSLIHNHYVYKISIATYVREIERYGVNLIEQTETLFYNNSECICLILKKIQLLNPNYRWMIAFNLVDNYFKILNIDINKRIKITEMLDLSYKSEFGYTMYNSKQLNVLYRQYKKNIIDILENKIDDENYLKACAIIIKSNKQMKEVLKQINNNDMNISSIMHMMINRLFVSQNRMHELLIYNFLSRYYKSVLAQQKNVL